jgi:ATP-dependent Zn protease
VAQAHTQVRQLRGEKKATLECLAQRLLEKEVLAGPELQALLTQELLMPAALSLV